MTFARSVTERQHYYAHLVMVLLATAAGVIALWPSDMTRLAGHASEQNAQMDLLIQVPPFAKLEAFESPNELDVLPAQVEAGYVDVAEATRMRVSFNTRQGFALQVNYDTAWVRRVDIWVDGQLHSVSEPNSKVVISRTIGRDIPLELRYRLHLVPGARAGLFAWPVSMSVSPVV